jgi:hypothetical protein
MARRTFAGHTRLAALVRRALRAADVGATRAFTKDLNTTAATEQLGRLARQYTSAFEAFTERGLAFEVAGCELILTTALGELLLVVEEVFFVDRDAATAAL